MRCGWDIDIGDVIDGIGDVVDDIIDGIGPDTGDTGGDTGGGGDGNGWEIDSPDCLQVPDGENLVLLCLDGTESFSFHLRKTSKGRSYTTRKGRMIHVEDLETAVLIAIAASASLSPVEAPRDDTLTLREAAEEIVTRLDWSGVGVVLIGQHSDSELSILVERELIARHSADCVFLEDDEVPALLDLVSRGRTDSGKDRTARAVSQAWRAGVVVRGVDRRREGTYAWSMRDPGKAESPLGANGNGVKINPVDWMTELNMYGASNVARWMRSDCERAVLRAGESRLGGPGFFQPSLSLPSALEMLEQEATVLTLYDNTDATTRLLSSVRFGRRKDDGGFCVLAERHDRWVDSRTRDDRGTLGNGERLCVVAPQTRGAPE